MLRETVVDEAFIQEMQKYKEKPVGKGLLEACSESVVLFSENMLGVKLRAWQVYVLKTMQDILEGKLNYREAVVLTSRQIGKTTLDAIFSTWMTFFNKKPSGIANNSPIGVISASDDQAKKLLNEIKRLLILGDKFLEKTYKDADNKPMFGKKLLQGTIDPKGANNTDTITFKRYNEKEHGPYVLKDSSIGTSVKSLPPTSSILGNTFALAIIDEAGKSEKIPDMVFLDYISPTIDEFNAPMFYTSTAWNPSGIFYEKCDVDDEHPNPQVWKVMFTIDAIKLEAPERYAKTMERINQLNADGKTAEVQRAYYCRFVKGETVYFDPDRVKESFTADYTMYDSFKGECDMGVDFGGKVTSRTVITITGLDEYGKIRRLFHKRYPVNEDMSLMDDIEYLLTKFNVQRIIPDDCPAGQHFINLMILKGWNVKPMNFRTDKVKRYGGFRAKLNKGLVESYVDNDLRTEMLAFEQSEKTKQSYIQHAPGYTDDMIDSFVMSSFYFVEEENKPEFFDWNYWEEDKNAET